jgi:hypothetical protein
MKESSSLGNIKLLFRPIRRVKLLISPNKLTIIVKGRENEFRKYIDVIIEAYDVDPLVTDIAGVENNDLLPPDAPLKKLANVLSELVTCLGKRKRYRVETELHHRLIPQEGSERDYK